MLEAVWTRTVRQPKVGLWQDQVVWLGHERGAVGADVPRRCGLHLKLYARARLAFVGHVSFPWKPSQSLRQWTACGQTEQVSAHLPHAVPLQPPEGVVGVGPDPGRSVVVEGVPKGGLEL